VLIKNLGKSVKLPVELKHIEAHESILDKLKQIVPHPSPAVERDVQKKIEILEKRPQSQEAIPPRSGQEKIPFSALKSINDLQRKVAELADRIDSLKPVRIPEGVKHIDTHKSMIEKLSNDIETLKKKITEIEKPVIPVSSYTEIKRHERKINGLDSDIESLTSRILRLEESEASKKTEEYIPPSSKEIETIKKKAKQNFSSIKNIMGYIKANEEHLNEMENRLSKFMSKTDIEKLLEFKEELKKLEEKVDKIESGPVVPPISSLPKKGMGRLLRKINDTDNNIKEMKKELEKEKKENAVTRAQMAKFFKDTKQELERIEETESKDVVGIEKNVSKEIARLRESMKETLQENKEQKEMKENEFKTIKRDMDQVKIFRKKKKKMDIEDISRNLESVKTKTQWLEQKIEELDLKPLFEKVERLENLLKTVRVSTPYVIE